jgi:hypothetical protein
MKDSIMKKTILATAAIVAFTLSSQFAVAQTAKPQVMAGMAMEDAGTIYDGVVTKIDAATRTVTLKSKDGEISVVAGPEVKNFAQIKVGDHFDVIYEIAVAMELVKVKNAGVRSEEVTTNTVTAPKGDKPGMVTTKVVTTVANVVAIDQAKKMVSIKGPQGNIIKLKIKNPALFKDIAVNDQVKAVYVEAIAAMVTAPKK